MEEELWDKTQEYIHKYNTRSSPKYAFAAAVLQQQSLENYFCTPPEFINHILHPETGAVCSYAKLAAGKVPGQEANIWTTGLANEFGRLTNGVGTRMKKGTIPFASLIDNRFPETEK